MPKTAPAPPPAPPPAIENVIVLTIRWRVTRGLLVCLAIVLSLFYLRTYERLYDPVNGWSKMIGFGGYFAPYSLPRLQRVTHYTSPPDSLGTDGEFYAQMAIDPSLRDPAFDRALDTPTYRGRRIGLPALSFVVGWGKPRWIVQVYAVANLFFWFLLMGVLFRLFRPTTGRHLLCLCAALLGYGIVTSMELAVTDLPATALIFLAMALGVSSWRGYGVLAAAALTRETSVLAALSFLDPRQSWRRWQDWRRPLGLLALGLVPFALWMLYVLHRFGHAPETLGSRNFSLPFAAMWECLGNAIGRCRLAGLSGEAKAAAPLGWLWADDPMRQPLAILSLFFQLAYLVVRRDLSSPVWRTGIVYAVLCACLGTAVWEECTNAVRAMLPMTICFYLLVARERNGWWFWPSFLLGGLSLPYAIHEFWVVT